ncbi:hypothetical protein [Phnomibacter sp. MR]|uniref:hypothetical protein n=1 Tax=Phnomibacter sp. MR TaxID=3042318 RepID=UPI003A80A892
MKRPYIIYSLSKDRTTQKFNKSKFQDIIKDIDKFLQSCTTTNIKQPKRVELTAYTAYDDTDSQQVLLDIIKKTTDKFGQSNKASVAYHYPIAEPHETNQYTWNFSHERLDEIIQYLLDNSPLPKSSFGPLELYFTYDFKLTDPTCKTILQNQDFTSCLLIWFSRGKACSPSLFFPFEQADKTFWNYVDSIIPFLPFKLEEKYLRIAHVNKQGEIKSFKKIKRPTVA